MRISEEDISKIERMVLKALESIDNRTSDPEQVCKPYLDNILRACEKIKDVHNGLAIRKAQSVQLKGKSLENS